MTIEDKALKLVEFIRSLTDFVAVNEIDGNYHHIGASIADAVLQANMKFETHVRRLISGVSPRKEML